MPGLAYLHHLALSRPTGGGSTNATGDYVAGGTATAVYDDAADVQDGEVVLSFAPDGTPAERAAAKVFLQDEVAIIGVRIGDTGLVTGERYGAGIGCEVVGVRVMDGVVFVNWLGSR